jgi:hypothetical protein
LPFIFIRIIRRACAYTGKGNFMVNSTIPLGQLVKRAGFLKKILNTDAEHLIYRYCQKGEKAVTDLYTGKLSEEKQLIFNYIVKYQSYGAMYLIVDWIKNDMPLPPKSLAGILHQLTSPFNIAEHALRDTVIPHVVLNIQTEE